MKFNNGTYDTLKTIALMFAPIATFIGALCAIWGVPYSEQITATLSAFDTMLGALLLISNKNYRADKLQDTFNEDDIEELYEVEDDEDEIDTAEE